MLRRRGNRSSRSLAIFPSRHHFRDLSAIGYLAVEHYLDGSVDQVFLIYTQFVSKAEQKLVIEKILPLTIPPGEKRTKY